MKLRNFIGLVLVISLVLGGLIYWREYTTRDQVTLLHVLLWQMGIWLPWILGFLTLKGLKAKVQNKEYGFPLLLISGLVLIALHFGWFFIVSSTVSPYLDLPGSKFGVYRYFFVFWTLIDVGLVWFIIDKLRTSLPQLEQQPIRLELTRGGNTYFCEPSQIQLLAAENYYTKLFTTQGVFVMRKPLKAFLDILPVETFRKIHRSTIINVDYVSELARGNGSTLEVIMKDGTRRRVSKSFVKEITDLFRSRTY
ncbi:LytTR family DNA-binding domain-containing protein [Flagellimonas myxillae]|uniref:LytTR family DNA-binding domain-containing protein n=1 Tax=Flagellimonas myxillae TaxID=2942214 RepID=UPI00201EC6EF|nr:LytTR family DNA-binding domain-containing protein [Muricauda myxillae]MCL6266999.1 LytTR family transcriptional regulator [Muricauda myxillae]